MGKKDKKVREESPKVKAPKKAKAPKGTADEGAGAVNAARSEQLRGEFERTRDVAMGGITGRETPDEILRTRFPAYVGRQ